MVIFRYNELYSKNMIFTDSWYLPHKDYQIVQRSFAIAMYNFLMDIDSVNADDYIDNYRISAKKSGADQILNDLNTEAGTTAKYGY